MAKILIPSFCNLTPHLETELEIIEQHLAKNDEVFYITCHHEMETCFHYYKPTFDECCYCRTRTKIGISLLSKNIHILSWPNDDSLHINNKYVFSDVNELRNFSIDGINYGLPVVSDLTMRLENEIFDVKKFSNIIESHINSSIYIYNSFNIILDKINPDIVYVFNGRFPITYPIIETCIKRNIDYYTHERSNSYGYYRISHNTLPHDAHSAYNECKNLFKNHNYADAAKEASNFYSLRRSSDASTGLCYTSAQHLKKLPDNFDIHKKNIVFFNSSEFEYSALPLAQKVGHYIYSSDSDMLSNIATTLYNNTTIHIYCRMHPNLAKSNSPQIRSVLDLSGKFKNLTIIPSSSDVDSYALMDSASIVLVNVSTMGAESSFWGKPVILVGYSLLNELEGFYQPHSHEELIQLLLSDLKPLPRTGAIMYGLWLRKGGIAFRHFSQTGFHSGTFKGVDLDKAAIPRYKLARAAKILLDLMFFYGKEEAAKSARKVAGKLAALLHIH